MCSFTKKLILKSFKAIGIALFKPNVILNYFTKTLENLDLDSTLLSVYSSKD
jgi:hypothetical protein